MFTPQASPSGMTPEQLRQHYEIEKELASRLRSAGREERRHLYTAVYDELYRRVPFHSQLTRKGDEAARAAVVALQMAMLEHFLKPDQTFLEVGPGDCGLSLEVARHVNQCYAVDVSEVITRRPDWPVNFQLFISDGTSIPLRDRTVDLVYSNQLMEHLHPEDAVEQLEHIYRVLKPGGRYVCRTPNRLTGPHDVSRAFDEVATGFHLREYTIAELERLFRAIGFTRLTTFFLVRGVFSFYPLQVTRGLERILAEAPRPVARRLAANPVVRVALGINLVAVK